MTVRLDKDRWPGRSHDRRDEQPQSLDITNKYRFYPPSGESGDHSVGFYADTALELAYKILAREGVTLTPPPAKVVRLPVYSTVSGESER